MKAFNLLLKWSLQTRWLVVFLAAALTGYGRWAVLDDEAFADRAAAALADDRQAIASLNRSVSLAVPAATQARRTLGIAFPLAQIARSDRQMIAALRASSG